MFKLLEAVYGAFDEIARRRGVFKVETIGDCYVAATGKDELYLIVSSKGVLVSHMRCRSSQASAKPCTHHGQVRV